MARNVRLFAQWTAFAGKRQEHCTLDVQLNEVQLNALEQFGLGYGQGMLHIPLQVYPSLTTNLMGV